MPRPKHFNGPVPSGMKCPRGHDLPHIGPGGVCCSPGYCAETDGAPAYPSVKERKENRKDAKERVTQKSLARTEMREIKEELATSLPTALEDTVWLEKMEKALGRYEARRVFAKIPKDLPSEQIKEFVERRLQQLLPDALARLEHDLKLGDEDVSRKTAYEVLDRTGFGKKDGGTLPGAPIIIVNQKDGFAYKPAFLVDAEVVDEK